MITQFPQPHLLNFDVEILGYHCPASQRMVVAERPCPPCHHNGFSIASRVAQPRLLGLSTAKIVDYL